MDHIARAAELRRKADQNRVEFIRTDLDACFTMATLAESEYRVGAREAAERARADAEKAYSTICRMLDEPQHADHLTADQRKEFLEILERLRTRLDSIGF